MSVPNVVSLLGALRKAGSPLTKAKLLALTVRGVRQLNPEERRQLVSRLGVDKADWFVDRLDDETNETTAELVRELIQQAGKTEPSKWKDLATRLRDPEERRRLLDEGLELLEDLPDAEEPATAAPEPSPISTDTVPEAPATATAKPEPGKPARPAKPVRVPAAPTPSPPSPTVGKQAVERRSERRVGARREITRQARVRARIEVPASDLASDLAATGSLVRRLRLLRERCGEAESLSAERLRRLVEAFPDGWARRRALSTLLTAGIPADFDTALGLIDETLDSPTDRRWCLGSLAGGRDLTQQQREVLLASLESPSWHRRFSRRLAAG